MVLISTIEKVIFDWAHLVLPTVKIIFYHENAPRPQTPYIALHLSTINSIGWDFVDGDGNLTGNRDFTVLCQGIGKSSMDYLEALKTSLERPKIQAFLNSKSVVFVERLAIACITELVDTRWEERNILDLKFRFAQTDKDNSGLIENINVRGIVKTDIITTIAEINIHESVPEIN